MGPEAAKERRALGGSSRLISNCPAARKSRREKGGEEEKQEKGPSECFNALPVARASEVGLAVSRNDPSTLRAGPFGADWKIPQSGWGPCQLLGKMSLQSLRASSPCFLLIQPVGCSALGCRLQTWTPERSPAWPLALPAESPPGAGDGAGQRWQPSFRMTKWAWHCAGEGIREDFLEEAAPEGQVGIN